MAPTHTDPKMHLNSLRTGLRALEILNTRDMVSVIELAELLGVPKTNARRVLNTLCASGYCEYLQHDHVYRLAPRVTRLSAGLSDARRIAYAASPLLMRKTKQIGWPLLLTTPVDEFILVRASSEHATSLALQQHPIGLKIPMALTTSGLVALAFLPERQQTKLLARLMSLPNPRHRPPGNPLLIKRAIDKVKEQGYAHRRPDDRRVSSIAVPVFVGPAFTACLRLAYIKSALSERQAEGELVPMLKALAADIDRETTCAKTEIPVPGGADTAPFRIREQKHNRIISLLEPPRWSASDVAALC